MNVRNSQDMEDLEYYLVGGAVRDELLGKKPKDKDFVVVGETEESMQDRGFKYIQSSSAYPVFQDSNGDEFALARAEESTGSGYGDFNFDTEEVTLEEDLERRDFTINAIAKDKDGNIVDPFDGKKDLNKGILRHVSDAFTEDPLRIIRMARFSARLDFDIHSDTKRLAKKTSSKLSSLPEERITQDFLKAMKQAEKPSKFFNTLKEVRAYEHISKPISKMTDKNIPAGPSEYHREGSVWEHTMKVVDAMHDIRGNDPEMLLCAFFHDIGKIETPRSDYPHHYGHDKEGAEVFKEKVTNDFKFTNQLESKIEMACKQHMRVQIAHEMNESKVIQLVEDLEKSNRGLNMEELFDLAKADDKGSIGKGTFNKSKIREAMKYAEKAYNSIDGNDVLREHDIDEGEKVGNILLQKRTEKMRELMN